MIFLFSWFVKFPSDFGLRFALFCQAPGRWVFVFRNGSLSVVRGCIECWKLVGKTEKRWRIVCTTNVETSVYITGPIPVIYRLIVALFRPVTMRPTARHRPHWPSDPLLPSRLTKRSQKKTETWLSSLCLRDGYSALRPLLSPTSCWCCDSVTSVTLTVERWLLVQYERHCND